MSSSKSLVHVGAKKGPLARVWKQTKKEMDVRDLCELKFTEKADC